MPENFKLLCSGDFNIFKEGYNAAGIYGISGLVHSSNFETPIYIGSAENLKQRVSNKHLKQLDKNEHANKPLQNYYNLYGINNIVVFLMKESPVADLIKNEQVYIDLYGIAENKKAFNICGVAGSSLGTTHTEESKSKMRRTKLGKKMTEEAKKNMRAAQLGRKHPEEVKAKIAKANTGKFITEEQKQSIGLKNSETFYALDINSGFIYEFFNLKKFCRDKRISSACLLATRKQGRRKRCKNWVLMDKDFTW